MRTFKKFLKDTDANVRADISSKSPEVYTGFVDELQQHFPVWYNMVYSEGHPPVACPAHLLHIVRRMQACMGCRCSKAGCADLGSLGGVHSNGTCSADADEHAEEQPDAG